MSDAQTVAGAVEQVAAQRKFLRLTRFPGHDAVLTIDGTDCRIVRLRVDPNVTEILFEETSHE